MIVDRHPQPEPRSHLHLSRLAPGSVNRATASMTEPSGKGVNVALALRDAGVDACAVLPVGGANGDEIVGRLRVLGLHTVGVPIAGAGAQQRLTRRSRRPQHQGQRAGPRAVR